jgi:hypothetical protein
MTTVVTAMAATARATQEQQERLVDEFLRRLEADDLKETA